jgi:UDP-N-acetylglucosamine enolpyruvyl transferase
MMIAALLGSEPVRLLNVPAINDVELVMTVIKEL